MLVLDGPIPFKHLTSWELQWDGVFSQAQSARLATFPVSFLWEGGGVRCTSSIPMLMRGMSAAVVMVAVVRVPALILAVVTVAVGRGSDPGLRTDPPTHPPPKKVVKGAKGAAGVTAMPSAPVLCPTREPGSPRTVPLAVYTTTFRDRYLVREERVAARVAAEAASHL